MMSTKMGTDLLLMQPEAQAVVAADTIPITVYNDSISVADDFKMERAARLFAKYDSRDRYEADLAVNHFDLHQFMPADSLYTLSTRLKVEGEGFGLFSPRTYFNAEGGIDRFHYGSYHLDRNFIGCRTGEIEGACFTGSEKLDHGYQGAFGWYLENLMMFRAT